MLGEVILLVTRFFVCRPRTSCYLSFVFQSFLHTLSVFQSVDMPSLLVHAGMCKVYIVTSGLPSAQAVDPVRCRQPALRVADLRL